eukprot:CAMPEP_0206435098 /NCGR_PEP_ID=MMETSP0324_2-20121206/9620_1 /ASSEMBLY_ACC=CAM_ASM_000836 /TAXON_ID=2866 /ORGANISM="Crypthecodinium cohnii, Strain Seligo" /LENGTH=641 /DNA_ID=CAMNT_0053901877 /DNA_START=140 /DNA_END=2065 /DNA_ORIENTATION=+
MTIGLHQLQSAVSLSSQDIMSTKVWLDQHLFNKTLKTTGLEGGRKVFLMDEGKARSAGLPWPPVAWPTLCFVGLGPSSIEYLAAMANLFPELQLALIGVTDEEWLDTLADTLGENAHRIELADEDLFAPVAGGKRKRRCEAIQWSVDSPPFSFYRYRHLFYSTNFPLALFNIQGCTLETHHERENKKDRYYCEYLYQGYKSTLCGRVTENRSAGVYFGQELYFPAIDSVCGEQICMCHAQSDVFLDFHFEHMCQKDREFRFMGQWGQDEFLVNNVFRDGFRRKNGVYIDVGASHPYHLSNTAFFDNCFGWRGICFEPNPRSEPILKALRTCKVISACAGSKAETVRFSNGAELATRTDDETLQPSDLLNTTTLDGTFFEARCAPLHDLLVEALPEIWQAADDDDWSGDRPIIDLISVDAEGAEIEIFRNFPFQVWDIRAIVVEVSRHSCMAVDSLLLPAGFVKVAVIGKDAVYVSRSWHNRLPESLILPHMIQWNEPGTDEDQIEYLRFQRYFGVEGNLDDDVGDQRLLNATELERQNQRAEAHNNQSLAKLVAAASKSLFGGVLSERERAAMEIPWVQEALKDHEVKAALAHLLAADEDAFRLEVEGRPRLQQKIAELYEAGAVLHSAAEEIAQRVKLSQ